MEYAMSEHLPSSLHEPDQCTCLPGRPAQIALPLEWSEVEKWVWQQVILGQVADFNIHYGELDPAESEGWSDKRVLSPDFLETILLFDPFRNALHRQGVRIVGAWFRQPIEMENGRITHHLWLEKCRIEKEVKLSRLECPGLSFDGSVFLRKPSLAGAWIKGQLDMSKVKCRDDLDLTTLRVDGSFLMCEGAELKNVNLGGARIGGQFSLASSTFRGDLNMNALEVGYSLFMCRGQVDGRKEPAEFREIKLDFARIGGSLKLYGSIFRGEINLTGTRIDRKLEIDNASLPQTLWKSGVKLVLVNTRVGTLVSNMESGNWPSRLALNGFTYSCLRGPRVGDTISYLGALEKEKFENWLQKDETYTPQPYRQLAGILSEMGHQDKANAILYCGKDRERREAPAARAFGLSVLKYTIGYGFGYRYFLSLLWIIGITCFGAIVFSTTREGAQYSFWQGLGYSFDLLLPLIEIDKWHFSIDLKDFDPLQQIYFYLHKLCGYVLASFVIAGFTGITQK